MSTQGTFRDQSDAARFARAALVAAVAAALVAGAALSVVLLRGHSGSASTAADSSPARTLTPPPVVSPGFTGLAVAGHAGDVLVGLGAYPGGPVDVVVVPSDEAPVRPTNVRVELRSRVFSGSDVTACGSRCLRFPLQVLTGRAATLVVDVARSGRPSERVSVRLPARMPARADALLRQARAHMLRLRALGMDETLGAGLSKPVVSRWSFQAPDRMRYSIRGGAKAVVIGTRRWDDFGRGWQRSSSPSLDLPTFPWQDARAARLLGSTSFGGTPVRVLAAWLPAMQGEAPIWFRLDVAPDGRVLRSKMLATAHFMTDTYRDLGAVPPITPPR